MNQQSTQGFTPFRQVPQWADDAIFEVTGTQLKAIQNLFEVYTPLVKAIEPVFIKALEDGKITIRYEDLEGNELQREDIDVMLNQYAETLAQSLDNEKETDS